MRIEQYLHLLDVAQTEVAREAMEKTGERDAFTYGRAAGWYAGLAHAKELLLGMMADKERNDFDL